jgi:hypothetical protein
MCFVWRKKQPAMSRVRDASCLSMTAYSEPYFPPVGPTPQAIHERVHTSVFTTLVCIMCSKHLLKVNHADFPKIWPPTVCSTFHPVSIYYSVPTECWIFEATCNINFNFIGHIKKFDRMIACPSSLPIQSTLKEVVRNIHFLYLI